MKPMNRRSFLKLTGATGAAALVSSPAYAFLEPIVGVDNPLDVYPERDWERVYHDQYRYDSSFTFVCSPNDTHACRVRAIVRNGIIVRTEQTYNIGQCKDLDGNRATRAASRPNAAVSDRRCSVPFRRSRYPTTRTTPTIPVGESAFDGASYPSGRSQSPNPYFCPAWIAMIVPSVPGCGHHGRFSTRFGP